MLSPNKDSYKKDKNKAHKTNDASSRMIKWLHNAKIIWFPGSRRRRYRWQQSWGGNISDSRGGSSQLLVMHDNDILCLISTSQLSFDEIDWFLVIVAKACDRRINQQTGGLADRWTDPLIFEHSSKNLKKKRDMNKVSECQTIDFQPLMSRVSFSRWKVRERQKCFYWALSILSLVIDIFWKRAQRCLFTNAENLKVFCQNLPACGCARMFVSVHARAFSCVFLWSLLNFCLYVLVSRPARQSFN